MASNSVAPPATQRVGLILLPGFALTSFSLAIETLSVANRISQQSLYEYTLYSGDPDRTSLTVSSSNGVPVHTRAHFSECGPCDTLVICAYLGAASHYDTGLIALLRARRRQGARIAALSNASFVLAQAGILTGRSCTLIGDEVSTFRELYPGIPVLDNLYTVNGPVLTCAGGMAALDMFLHIVAEDHGRGITVQISQQFLQDRIRAPGEVQHARRYLDLRMQSPTLGAAIEIMEANLERPVPIARLAEKIGTTPRTLEQVFRRFTESTPSHYYRRLRLEAARRMVEETNLAISAIAHATGFSSQSYFTKCFRQAWGVQPRRLRKRKNYP